MDSASEYPEVTDCSPQVVQSVPACKSVWNLTSLCISCRSKSRTDSHGVVKICTVSRTYTLHHGPGKDAA